MKLQKVAAIGSLCVMLFGLAGCHATPGEEFVQQKDQERLIEKAQATARTPSESASASPTPTTESFFTESADGKLRVSMEEVPVMVPEGGVPMARVSLGRFSDEEAAAIVQLLLGDDAFEQEGEGTLTKSDIEGLIVQYKGWIADGTVEENTVYTREEMMEELERLEKEYASAPDSTAGSGPKRFSDTMSVKEIDGEKLHTADVTSADGVSLLSIVSSDDPDSRNAMSNVFFLRDKDASPDDTAARDAAVGDNLAETGMIYEEALGLCTEFLEAAGVPDAAPAAQRLVDAGHGPAYEFQFVRTVDGVPAAYFQSTYEPEEEGVVPWGYERITIAVGASGIEYVYWDDRTEPGEVLNESVQVLPLEDAQEVFERMIEAVYEPQTEWLSDDERIEVTVDDVQLAPIRIREAGSQGRDGLYVPAWLYYGRISNPAEKASMLGPDDRRLILAVNAVDGSVIDLRKGY